MKEMGVPRYTDPSASVKNTFPGKQAPLIGVFDSGVGGLSILRALWAELPGLPVLYMADQVHVPYGRRSIEEVRQYSLEISRWLIAQGVKLIVVACNTASAVALHTLRKTFPDIPFVGMEPAVKPAEQTHNGKAGVLATPVTFQENCTPQWLSASQWGGDYGKHLSWSGRPDRSWTTDIS